MKEKKTTTSPTCFMNKLISWLLVITLLFSAPIPTQVFSVPTPVAAATKKTPKLSKTANAGYNNYTKYARDVDDYYQGDPWCAMFISWCMMKTYGRNTAKKLLKDWPYVACRYLPYYLPSYNTPKKGDIVLFYNGSDYEHTGLVTKVQGARFWTIEGNTKKITEVIPEGYCVCEKSYYIKTLPKVKFCRPQYQIAV